jgi:sorbitol-specific phosphotransferase system component IIC
MTSACDACYAANWFASLCAKLDVHRYSSMAAFQTFFCASPDSQANPYGRVKDEKHIFTILW